MQSFQKISIGDYIINNGDLGALIIVNVISRFQNSLINQKNIINETFLNNFFSKKNYLNNKKLLLQRKINNTIINKNNIIELNKNTEFYRPDFKNKYE